MKRKIASVWSLIRKLKIPRNRKQNNERLKNPTSEQILT